MASKPKLTEIPAVAEIRARIAQLPEGGVLPAFEAALIDRATAAHAAQTLTERLNEARAIRDAAISHLTRTPTPQAVDDAVTAEHAVTVLERLATAIPTEPKLDQAAFDDQIGKTSADIVQSLAHEISLVQLAFVAEMQQWRQASRTNRGVQFDPPVPTDTDRHLQPDFDAQQKRIDDLYAANRQWNEHRSSGMVDPLNLIAFGASIVQGAAQVRDEVDALNIKINAANRERREAGLIWQPHTAAQRFVAAVG